MQTYATLEDLATKVGQPIGRSDWIDVPQSRIQQFADATEDH
jgi:acyl dehydratase